MWFLDHESMWFLDHESNSCCSGECGFNLEVLLPKSLLASNLKGSKKSFLPRDLRPYKQSPDQIVNAFTTYTIKFLIHSSVLNIRISTLCTLKRSDETTPESILYSCVRDRINYILITYVYSIECSGYVVYTTCQSNVL